MLSSTVETNPDSILGTLDKGLRLLEQLAADPSHDGLTLTEISRRLDMHRTTVFRLLATLRARGFVARDPRTDRYRLGVKLLALAHVLLSQLDVREIARPALLDLRDRTRELVHLTIRDGDDVVTIDRFEGTQPLSLQTEMGARRPIYCTGSGKAILAFARSDEVDRILGLGMPRLTANTITDPEVMKRELAAIRERGFAIDDEERNDGVRCVAAAVFAHDGSVLGAVSMAAPALRMPNDRVRRLGEEVSASAKSISRQLGHVC